MFSARQLSDRKTIGSSPEAQRVSKKVCSSLGPLCEGAPPTGGGGRTVRLSEIFRAMASSLPPPLRGTSLAEEVFDSLGFPRGSHLPVSSPIEHRACASVAEHLDPARDVQRRRRNRKKSFAFPPRSSACRKRCARPLAPSAGGSACRRWGRELYGCPKYFGLWQGSLPPPLRGTSLAEGGFSTAWASPEGEAIYRFPLR